MKEKEFVLVSQIGFFQINLDWEVRYYQGGITFRSWFNSERADRFQDLKGA